MLAPTFVAVFVLAAGDEPDLGDLDSLLNEPVVAVASRTAESAQDAPATTWSISGTDLKRYGIQSVEEAIRFLGHGMTSFEYDGRASASFGARGYMSDQLGLHLAVLIDGNQGGGSAKTGRGVQGWLLPIELVDHIDIVIGPGSVVYGNSAMLGIINVITRSPSSIDGTHVVVQQSAGTPGDPNAKDYTWGEEWTRAAIYGGFSRMLAGDPFELSWHWAARYDRQQGRAVFRRIDATTDHFIDPPSKYAREDAFNRDFGTKLFARARWGNWKALAWFGFTTGVGTGPVEGTASSTYIEPEYGLDITYATTLGKHGDLSLRFYGVVFDSNATEPQAFIDAANCQATVGNDVCINTLHWLAFRPFLEPILSWDWNNDGSHVSTLGAQAFIDGSIITTGTRTLDGTVAHTDEPVVAPVPNGALYAQHIWRGRLGTLNVGLRGDVGFIGNAISPRIAYSTSPWSNGTLKLIVSTGFRQPTITERFLEIPHFVTANEGIRPERVYSGEVVFGHRFSKQSLQLSVFAAYWEGLITAATIIKDGDRITQFQNLKYVWSAGFNLGWRGEAGPLDWALSLNYAPGRVRLPGDAAQYSDQQLADLQVQRGAIERYGTHAFGSTLLPTDAMPDFYATAHVSWSMGFGLPRLSVAANLQSPRIRAYYINNTTIYDPRFSQDPYYGWSADVRLAISHALTERVGLSLFGTFRTLSTVAETVRVGNGETPQPNGKLGFATNPQAPVSLMAELNVRL